MKIHFIEFTTTWFPDKASMQYGDVAYGYYLVFRSQLILLLLQRGI